MDQTASSAAAYICPMHSGIRQSGPGKCPKCGMDLLPEGTRFASTHDESPVASRSYAHGDGSAHGSGHDDDALTGFLKIAIARANW
jgi:P-type Cu+ transporter